MNSTLSPERIESLQEAFGDRLQSDVPMAPYTSARIGGPADFLLVVQSASELTDAVRRLWQIEAPFRVIGGGSNILVADDGVRGLVIVNRARAVRFDQSGTQASVWAESGASIGGLARRSIERGLSGLEWAATVPGSVGGAVVGNAGAHGGDVAESLMVAEILHYQVGKQAWPVERLQYSYRSSWLKRNPGQAVVLAASFRLTISDPEITRSRAQAFLDHRRDTQPGGASLGSMFKNPNDDYAGRLIEAAGLKGLTRGQAQISKLHANFFVNLGGATAGDVWELLTQARRQVKEQFGVALELEIELVGDWNGELDGAGGDT